uniref:uncharacterized protein LOC122610222 n=1 Tax=Erigeron canadensis TaxID=72917 RepID=UPI001CB9996A|nr:uncharacterized protein LOC122610222 [Erigeron canadensis]
MGSFHWRNAVINEAYNSMYSVHSDTYKMYHDIRELYSWTDMRKDVAVFVRQCLTYLRVKAEHRKPVGLLGQPEIPEWKWKCVTMNFITKFARMKEGQDTIWVIVDRLTKSVHFLVIREKVSTEELVKKYVKEFMSKHGIPVPIISDMILVSILILGEDFREFSHNNSYHTSIKIAPFEALYGRKCRSLVAWSDYGNSQLVGPELIEDTAEKIIQIKEQLRVARERQKKFLLRFVVSGKLGSRYTRPFEVLKRVSKVAYRLRHSGELEGVHCVFQLSHLRKCQAEEERHVPMDEIQIDNKLNFVEEPLEIADRKVRKFKKTKYTLVKVRWNLKRGTEYTWKR